MVVSLPQDALVLIASWVKRKDLLALRGASAAGRDAVRGAVVGHEGLTPPLKYSIGTFFEGYTPPPTTLFGFQKFLDPRKVEAVGRVLGGGCKSLNIIPGSDDLIAAYRSFIVNAQHGLVDIHVRHVFPLHLLAELCGLTRNLRQLIFTSLGPNPWNYTESELVDFAAQLGPACPFLENFHLPNLVICPAEMFNKHFSKREVVEFGGDGINWYTPTRFDRIEESIAACETNDLGFEGRVVVEPELIECLLRTSLADRLESLHFGETRIEESTILEAARGFRNLRSLRLPFENTYPLAFHESLANIRPELIDFDFGICSYADDEVVRLVCARYSLKVIHLDEMSNVTPAFVDIILASPCSETLTALDVVYLDSEDSLWEPDPALLVFDILRLVIGCPNLVRVETHMHGNPRTSEHAVSLIKHIRQIIEKNRGGKFILGHSL